MGGQDATEAFEDVGHSDEAREILEGLLVGNLKRGVRPFSPFPSPIPFLPPPRSPSHLLTPSYLQENDPPAASTTTKSSAPKTSSEAAGLGIGLYAIILVGGALAFFGYQYLQSSGQQKA